MAPGGHPAPTNAGCLSRRQRPHARGRRHLRTCPSLKCSHVTQRLRGLAKALPTTQSHRKQLKLDRPRLQHWQLPSGRARSPEVPAAGLSQTCQGSHAHVHWGLVHALPTWIRAHSHDLRRWKSTHFDHENISSRPPNHLLGESSTLHLNQLLKLGHGHVALGDLAARTIGS